MRLFRITRSKQLPKRLFAGSTKDSPAQIEDARKTPLRKNLDILIQQSNKTAVYPNHLHTVVHNGCFTHTPNGCIDAGAVATGRKNPYFHCFTHLCT